MTSKQHVKSSLVVCLICFLRYSVETTSADIIVQNGGSLSLPLPKFRDCGQFTLLDPYISPVVVIEGLDSLSVIGRYIDRVRIEQTDLGFNLTILNVTEKDGGKYKIAPSAIKLLECRDTTFSVIVKESLSEYLEPWSKWTECWMDCDSTSSRTRERNCSIDGACFEMGDLMQIESCDKASHCPHWTDWGSFGACSAKCGKGFKIRKRVCLSGDSSLLKQSDCRGTSTQSHMCMTVCELIGDWGDWGKWSNCSQTCNGGTRNRTRECDPRFPSTNCTGDGVEDEPCNTHICPVVDIEPDRTVGTSTIPPTNKAEEPLNTAVVLVLTCVITVIVVCVILGLLCRKRLIAKRKRNALASRQDTPPKQVQKTSKISKSSKKRPSKPESGNLYSELSSNFCYDSSEFDAVSDYPVETPTINFTAENDRNDKHNDEELDNIANDVLNESMDIDVSDSEFDDDLDASGNDAICETNEVMVNDNIAIDDACDLYSEPPVIEDHADTLDRRTNKDSDKKHYEGITRTESIYSEPPASDVPYCKEEKGDSKVSSNGTSINVLPESDLPYSKEKTCDVNASPDDMCVDVEPYDDNVYENYEVNNGRLDKADIIENKIEEQNNDIGSDNRFVGFKKSSITICDCPVDGTVAQKKDSTVKYSKPIKQQNSISKTTDSITGKQDSEPLKHGDQKWSTDGNEEHTYVNETVSRDTEYFYVTPKYLGIKKDHVYDTPKVNN